MPAPAFSQKRESKQQKSLTLKFFTHFSLLFLKTDTPVPKNERLFCKFSQN